MIEDLLALKEQLPDEKEQKEILKKHKKKEKGLIFIYINFAQEQSKFEKFLFNFARKKLYMIDGLSFKARSTYEALMAAHPQAGHIFISDKILKSERNFYSAKCIDAVMKVIEGKISKKKDYEIIFDLSHIFSQELELKVINLASFSNVKLLNASCTDKVINLTKISTLSRAKTAELCEVLERFARNFCIDLKSVKHLEPQLAKRLLALSNALKNCNLTHFCEQRSWFLNALNEPQNAEEIKAIWSKIDALGLGEIKARYEFDEYLNGRALGDFVHLSRMYFDKNYHLNAAILLYEGTLRCIWAQLGGRVAMNVRVPVLRKVWGQFLTSRAANSAADLAEKSTMQALRAYADRLRRARGDFAHISHGSKTHSELAAIIDDFNEGEFLARLRRLKGSKLSSKFKEMLKMQIKDT